MKLEHWIEWHAAYDKRDPDPSKNYGVHGVDMRWYVRGENGVVQFVIYTNWHLPHIIEEQMSDHHRGSRCQPMPADIGYHSLAPQYESQTSLMDECPLLNNRPCYYDGSTMHAETVFKLLIEEGGDAVWEYLDEYYVRTFGG